MLVSPTVRNPVRHTPSLIVLAALSASIASAEGFRFVDRAAEAGLDLVTPSGSEEKPHILESSGSGVLVLDFDGDGAQDLYFVSAQPLPPDPEGSPARSRLYRNRGDGTFDDVTEPSGAGLELFGQGGCVGDVDGDELPDLYVTAFGPNELLRNRGDGTFEPLERFGAADPGWSIGCTFFDGDGDGDHDLYVANYVEATWKEVLGARRTRLWRGEVRVMDGPRGLPEAANAYYRNEGGRFVDATDEAGFREGGPGYSMAVLSFDPDRDGDPDVFVANDSTPNRLYRNLGGGRFEEIGSWSGVAYDGDGTVQGSMGVGAGDFDGNGFPDLVVTNFAHDHYTLYGNRDGTHFSDDSVRSGLALATYEPLGWAALPADFDLDGDLDLFLANGHIYPQVDEAPQLREGFRQANQLLRNDEGRFVDVSAEAGPGLAAVQSSRGGGILDLEIDGDSDLVVSNQDAAPTLLVNELPPRAEGWLRVAPTGVPIGARIRVVSGGGSQERELTSGGSYASQNELAAAFGGGGPEPFRLEIRWPGGRQAWSGIPSGRVVRVLTPSRETGR